MRLTPCSPARYVTAASFPNPIARSWNGCATQQYLSAMTIIFGVKSKTCLPIPSLTESCVKIWLMITRSWTTAEDQQISMVDPNMKVQRSCLTKVKKVRYESNLTFLIIHTSAYSRKQTTISETPKNVHEIPNSTGAVLAVSATTGAAIIGVFLDTRKSSILFTHDTTML